MITNKSSRIRLGATGIGFHVFAGSLFPSHWDEVFRGFSVSGNHVHGCKDAGCGYMGCNRSLAMNSPWPCQRGSETWNWILSWKQLMYHPPKHTASLKTKPANLKSGWVETRPGKSWGSVSQHWAEGHCTGRERESQKEILKRSYSTIFIAFLQGSSILHSPLGAERPSKTLFKWLSINSLWFFCLHWSWI